MSAFLYLVGTVQSFLRDRVFSPIGKWVEQHRRGVSFALVFGVLALIYNLSPVMACSTAGGSGAALANVQCFLMTIVVQFLTYIVEMFGKLMILLIDIFLHFAQYNGFSSAQPVTLGWPIVRDVCNMFFIVILLVSAFATIIGYPKDYDYRSVLPKLLLMAVLINFSKTLIQLMIDFSQVVMLSFVNAFRAAGAGNFAQIFQFDKMLNFVRADPTVTGVTGNATGNTTGNAATDLANYGNIIATIILAIVLMIVACGVMIIMVMYLIARIIGLWIALIFSPIAFFATALPGSLQKPLSVFTSKYWSKLSAMLTGGPIIAFFLWLTFAVVQGAGGQLAQGMNLVVPASGEATTQTFLGQIGNTQSLATFIVGVAMMMMALEQAASIAGQVDDTIGGYAKDVAKRTKALASTTAKYAAGGAVTIATAGAAPAAFAVGNRLQRKLDLQGRLAKNLRSAPLGIGSLLNDATKDFSSALGGGKGMSLKDIQTANTNLEKKEQKENMEFYESLPGRDKGRERNWINRKMWEGLGLSTKAEMGTVGEQNQKYASEGERKNRVKEEMDRLTKGQNLTKDQRAQLQAEVQRKADKDSLEALDVSKKAYGRGGMTEKALGVGDEIDKMYEKDPALITQGGLLSEEDAKAKEKEVMKKLQKDKAAAEASTVGSDVRLAMKMLPDQAWIKKGGTGADKDDIVGLDPQLKAAFMETHKGTKAADAIDAIEKQALDVGGLSTNDLKSLTAIGKDANGVTRMYDPNKAMTDSTRYRKSSTERKAESDVDAAFTGATNGRLPALPGMQPDLDVAAGDAAYQYAKVYGAKEAINNKKADNLKDFAPSRAIGEGFDNEFNTATTDHSTASANVAMAQIAVAGAAVGTPAHAAAVAHLAAEQTKFDDAERKLQEMFSLLGELSTQLQKVDVMSRAHAVSKVDIGKFTPYIVDPGAFTSLNATQKKSLTTHFSGVREVRDQLVEKQTQGLLTKPEDVKMLADLDKQVKDMQGVMEAYKTNPARRPNDPRYPAPLDQAINGKD